MESIVGNHDFAVSSWPNLGKESRRQQDSCGIAVTGSYSCFAGPISREGQCHRLSVDYQLDLTASLTITFLRAVHRTSYPTRGTKCAMLKRDCSRDNIR